MRFRSPKSVTLVMAGVIAAGGLSFLLCSGPKSEHPSGDLSLAHFREVTIPFTQSSFGLREWKYAGDPGVGVRPQSFTDFWVGSLQVSTRLPASVAAIPVGLAGLGLFGLIVIGTWRVLFRA